MFPGALADREEARYGIIGVPLDVTTTFRPGTRFGPDSIRTAARPFEDYDQHTGVHFTDCNVYDHGDIEPAQDVAEYIKYLRGVCGDFSDEDILPLLVGGEHTVTIPSVRALDPDVYVTLDAHLDLRTAYAGTSLSHATVTHHVRDHVDQVIILGGRSGCEAEWDRATDSDVEVIPPDSVPAWEPPFDSEAVYLSVDIDAADPGFAPATGTPEPGGLTPVTMLDTVRSLAPSCIGFDVVEVNDRDTGETAALGAKLIRAFVYAHVAA